MFEHDFKAFPELRNNQLADLECVSPHPQLKEDFEAVVVKVSDGDTISLHISSRDFDFPLRISEINTKELSEGVEGMNAKDWLARRLTGELVYIVLDDKRVEKWGRLLGKVRHKGIDVGQEMVNLGLAVLWENRNDGKIINVIERYKWLTVQ